MTGNRENARLALDNAVPVFDNTGTTRYIYLIDGVIYKVDRPHEDSNVTEYHNLKEWAAKGVPNGVRLPECELYSFDDDTHVIAMEYIKGQPMGECWCMDNEPHTDMCMPPEVLELVSPIIDDTGGFNVIATESGEFYIIDLAM